VLLASGCSQTSTSAANTLAGPALPTFSDWRTAYVDQNGQLHVVSLDGKNDVVGPNLPAVHDPGYNGGHIATAGIASNGRKVAYYTGHGGINVVDIGSHPPTGKTAKAGAPYDVFWSPDGSRLALGDGVGQRFLLMTNGGDPTPIPGVPADGVRNIRGWIDATHLAVIGILSSAPSGPGVPASFTLSALDVTSGSIRHIATISALGLGTPWLSLSPDGTKALVYNRRFRDDAYTLLVKLVDTATGKVTSFDGITNATGSGFTSVAWGASASTIAVSTGFDVNGDLKTWLLDLDHDTSTHLMDGQYVMGWTPGNGPLITSTGWKYGVNGGPYVISAVTPLASGQPSVVRLTAGAYSFSFVGFVRTA
jgi:hypothetical protein